jgi:hypothetical protein
VKVLPYTTKSHSCALSKSLGVEYGKLLEAVLFQKSSTCACARTNREGGKAPELRGARIPRYPRCENSGPGNAWTLIQDRASIFTSAMGCVLLILSSRGYRDSPKPLSSV